MQIAVTGASGLIGSALVPALRADGHDVLALVRREARDPSEVAWDPEAGTIDSDRLGDVEAIVHLASENIEKRWSARQRQRVLRSRVDGTRLIAETAAGLPGRPALYCASASGFYGDRGDEVVSVGSERGEGFLAEVVEDWEAAAQPARDASVRVLFFRQGLVLTKQGGALARMLLPFRLGLGGRVGSGRQWWSWVGLDDVVGAYRFALDRGLEGTFDLVAPGTVRNAEFTAALGRVLGRPTVLRVPEFAVRLAWGQMGEEILLGGQRVSGDRLVGEGFRFAEPQLEGALRRALAAGG